MKSGSKAVFSIISGYVGLFAIEVYIKCHNMVAFMRRRDGGDQAVRDNSGHLNISEAIFASGTGLILEAIFSC